MIDFSKLPPESVIICPEEIKDLFLRSFKKIYACHFKFLTKEELRERAYFTYSFEALEYVHQKYGYSLSLADEVLSRLKGIKKGDEKLEILFNIYQDLLSHSLLKEDALFPLLFKGKQTLIIGYSSLDLELKTALDKLQVSYSYVALKDEDKGSKEYLAFQNKEEEVNYVFNLIGKLISSGVELKKIFIFNPSEEYAFLLEKTFSYYQWPFDDGEQMSLASSPLFLAYLAYLNNNSPEASYQKLKEESKEDNYHALDRLVSLLEKILPLKLEKEEFIELLTYEAKKTYLKKKTYEDQISFCSASSYLEDDCYAFLLGFQIGNYPQVFKDTDFFSDEEKKLLGLNDSVLCSKLEEEKLGGFIKRTKNLTLTYKKKDGKADLYPSLLAAKLGIKEADSLQVTNERYSLLAAQIECGKGKDLLFSYLLDTPYKNAFTDQELDYRSYDHSFKPLSDYRKKKVDLSYSQIDMYQSCPFKYFVTHILHGGTYEQDFAAHLGSFYHDILQRSYTEEIDFSKVQTAIDNDGGFKNAKEKFLAKMNLYQVQEVIKKNKEFLAESHFNTVKTEQEEHYKLTEQIAINGKIDKILTDETTKKALVVDYKTGDLYFDVKKTVYGFDLQLPFYAFMLSKTLPFYQVGGIYIQKILYALKEQEPYKCYLMDGVTLADPEMLKRIDPLLGTKKDPETGKDIKTSPFIAGMKLKADGSFAKAFKVYDSTYFASLIDLAGFMVDYTASKIFAGEFMIQPRKFSTERRLPCDLCEFKDICYVNAGDVVSINPLFDPPLYQKPIGDGEDKDDEEEEK
ncbi:MAG: PD-(D/E)XK nuclease family protein [Bacilli bacterium]|jgi:ATP-dependent helicase/DNAse subunit B|nr:PD-(D/E)XK nuclease family protein [Bacilli bacterium]